ncbi:MAG TPA: sigma-70 family RNA polymerase sigma factor [Solirubrobacteraceae bacterium]|nr:sigma-70 family RNA polymerase sigma factor [Solirubrobacteraceae bacterium]
MPELAVHLTDPARADDEQLLEALRRGDERAFVALVRRYGALMQRVALGYVRTPAVAEEVVQETWCAVLTGLERFEGRAALKTWLFRILTNRAKTRGQREARSVPLSSLTGEDDDGPAVDPDRFLPADHARWPGHWAAGPAPWSALPHERLLAREVRARVRAAIETLPERQQAVVVLRDVEGWPPEEVCETLDLSEGNQRVLLHRARSKVRAELERYFADEVAA